MPTAAGDRDDAVVAAARAGDEAAFARLVERHRRELRGPLLPHGRLGRRGRGPGPGDVPAGVAAHRRLRGPVDAAGLAVPHRHQRLPGRARDHDLSVSGPGLAQHAFAAGLVDEVLLFVFPIVVGGGKPGLPRGVRVDLELLDERRFGTGVVHMRYGRR